MKQVSIPSEDILAKFKEAAVSLEPKGWRNTPQKIDVPLPTLIGIDIGNMCQLKCPLCPTGAGKLKHKQIMMGFDKFKVILDRIPSAKVLMLYNWGEPFLNKDIFKMIQYARKKDLYVQIDTNFSLEKDDQFFMDIIESGISEIVISLDGCSQSTYQQYRVGGSFDLVFTNMERLAAQKRVQKSKSPLIIWKFLINKYNEHELDRARSMAQQIGVEFRSHVIDVGGSLPDISFEASRKARVDQWLPTQNDYVATKESHCPYLFEHMKITPEGKVFPCCYLTHEKNTFGDLTQNTLEEIWQNQKYRYSRSLFVDEEYKGENIKTVCSNCNNFKKVK